MKAVMLMFDSLRKDLLSAYGNEETITPNFQRLKEKTVAFEHFYVGSMPCMPARRELHTGRYNFLHRSWGPLESWENSAVEIMKKNGIYTHLVTDHKHYWRDGGATYHPRYSSYEFIRGQEGDNWKGVVDKPHVDLKLNESPLSKKFKSKSRDQDFVNRRYMTDESMHPLCRTVQAGLEFIDTNHQSDQWYLQIECFDPHEPFFVPEKYLKMYGLEEGFHGWPSYYYNNQDGRTNELLKGYYKALVSMCDAYVGKVLDAFDRYDLWKDTMLIVNTDHGFLLGEHDWWGKNIMPIYNEIANIPFFIYDPRSKIQNEQRQSIAQNIDVPATLLDYFGLDKPQEMMGQSLKGIIEKDEPNRLYAMYGYFGSNINITDGHYTYMHAPITDEKDHIFEYTIMPTHINSLFSTQELQGMTLVKPFPFTKGVPLLKIPAQGFGGSNYHRFKNRLYHIDVDPKQTRKIEDKEIQCCLIQAIKKMMKENDAPDELYSFYGFDHEINPEYLKSLDQQVIESEAKLIQGIHFTTEELKEGYLAFIKNMPDASCIVECFKKQTLIDETLFYQLIEKTVGKERINDVMYQLNLNMRLD